MPVPELNKPISTIVR
jgi:hypothetical protein